MPGAPLPINPNAGSTTNPITSRFYRPPANATAPNNQQMMQAMGYWYGSQDVSVQQKMNYLATQRMRQAEAQQALMAAVDPVALQQRQELDQYVQMASNVSQYLPKPIAVATPALAWLSGRIAQSMGMVPSQPTAVSPEEMTNYLQTPESAMPGLIAGTQAEEERRQPGTKEITQAARIGYLEQSIGMRKAQVAGELYQFDPETGQFTYKPGRQMIGVPPGYVAAPALNRPAPNAPPEEWARYEQMLRQQIRKPMYSEADYVEEFNNLGTEGLIRFQKRLIAAGIYDENEPVRLGFIGEVEQTAMSQLMGQANINGITYDQALDSIIQARKEMDAAGGGGGGGGGRGGTFTNVTYSLTSIAQARQILASVLKTSIGRDPTEAEVNQFLRQLNAAEREAPVITTTTSTGQRSVSRTRPSTVDPQDMALDFAKRIGGGDEYMENRAMYYLNLIAQKYGYGFGQG